MTTTFQELARDGHLIYSDGYRTRRDQLAATGYRIIRVADVGADVVRFDSPDFVSAEQTAAIGAKAAQAGDILLTTKGTVGRVAVMPEAEGNAVYSPQLCFFRVLDGGVIVPGYLKAWFRSSEFWQQAAYFMNNTDMAAYISLRDLGRMNVTLPDTNTQRAIAEVLGALDDKIAANDRKLGTVNDLEDAIYLSACADVRTIPVGAAAEFLNRRRIPLSSRERSERQGVVPYYGAAGQIDTVDSALFDEPIVLVGEDGTVQTGDGRAVVQYVWGLSWVNNHAHVLVGKGVSTDVLRVALRRLSVADAVTGAVQPKLSMARLSALPLLVPTDERLASLGGQLTVLGGVIRETTAESRALTALRDALLPELMSGRLRVKDAESTVEEVL
ncbi:restriction endonuclease subunit S domain-containing protein [Mobilicoccus massiliensis]|uniref:restriction endonuclease subunit S n=1 Tax=Mobilicoccus massiliensis TaxID=1522310 RepID=UPI000693CD75|nr:restriction endonuclease subunit S [Mobilicoccus massiliensis]